MKNIIQASAVAAVLITGAMAPAAAGGNDSFREICGNDIQFDSIQMGRDNYQSVFLCGRNLAQASSTWGIGSKEVISSTGFGHRGNTSIEGNAVQLFQLQEGFGHRFDLDSTGSFNSFDSRQKGALHRSTHFNRGHRNDVLSVQEGVGHTSETRTFGSNIRVNVYQGN